MKNVLLGVALISCMLPTIVAAQIEVKVTTDKDVYKPEETVVMTLTATNVTKEPIKLEFSTSQRYDFVVYFREKEVWKWSADKLFILVSGYEYLEPGESLVYTTDEYTAAPDPGTYRLVGILTSIPPYEGETTFDVEY